MPAPVGGWCWLFCVVIMVLVEGEVRLEESREVEERRRVESGGGYKDRRGVEEGRVIWEKVDKGEKGVRMTAYCH